MTLVTMAEFARIQKWDRSYVTRLKQAGRLVMREDRVDVQASQALIAQTATPHRDDVVARHAENRGASPPETTPATPPTASSEPPAAPDADRAGNSYQAARAVKEKYQALAAKADYERQIGQLIDIQEVEQAFKTVGAQIRSLMETFPDQVAPLVAPVATLEDCHALLTEQCRNVLVNFNAACLRQAEGLANGGA